MERDKLANYEKKLGWILSTRIPPIHLSTEGHSYKYKIQLLEMLEN